MPDTAQLDTFAVKSYRYLRLSIVVVVAALLSSVLIEVVRAGCVQESISAYYYTPVHAVFVGALVALGVGMVAIRGATDVEDVLLNIAGVLAPIVAFVPTTPPAATDSCRASAVVGVDPLGAIDNNVLALAIGVVIALLVAAIVAWRHGSRPVADVDPRTRWGLLAGAVVLAGGLIWYFGFSHSFLTHAHGIAAGLMFALVWVVIVINAVTAGRTRDGGRAHRAWVWYALFAAIMAAAAISALVIQLAGGWRYQILFVEVLELTPFMCFWAVQTAEFWDGGVPTGAARAARDEAAGPGVTPS